MISETELKTIVESVGGSPVTDVRWVDGKDALRIRLADGRVGEVPALVTLGESIEPAIVAAFGK